ncbi:ankyrin repeat domain-containing protein 17-like isoform X3 [Cimex lectularius]|uniref:K Homology domain-containing protein n=1 Tax=Cimex lectularius TaxID=79782 RepID=A0A8I6SG09_CIMLE|nr:ankyrin repeat domain-containing protein 17-like isoform X3 [Cimex lectularius]
MQNVGQESGAESQKLDKVSSHEIGKSSTPQSSNSSPTKSDSDPFSELNPRFLSDSSESEEEDVSEVESFVIDQVADLDDSDARLQPSKFLLAQEDPEHSVDPETQARLEALLEAAGKLASGDGKQLADPEVLRRLTSSVSCALDEAAAALTRMRTENPRPQPERTLVEACTDGDVGTVRKLLTEGRSVHETTDEGESLLSLACSAGYYELAQVLLAMHANVEDRGIKGDCTPLMEAASSGYVDIVRLLIHHGADVNAQSSSGNTPLMYACAGGHLDAVRVLLDAGANVEDHNENGHTPLMEAASAGHVQVAEILLERGAGINTHSNEFKESALTLACYKGHLDMVRFLLEAGADQEHKTDEMHTALMEASMDGHVEVARLLLDSGAQVNMPTDSFESPLTLAACGGHVDLALLLIERGANIEEVNDEGYTPLMEAAREGHEDMVAILLVKGANINAQTEETQETALTLACCGGFLEVANFLIKNGAEIELGASTPLMEAAQEGHLELVRYLLEVHADVNAQTQTGDTALTYSCENGHTEVAKLLLQYGADLEHESEGGRTPLMKACRAGHVCTVKFLLSQNANVNKQTTNNDHTPLSLAAAGGHIAVVDLLLSQSANPFHKLKDNSTMLIEAAKGGHTNVVQLLLDYPHSIMMRGEQQGTPGLQEVPDAVRTVTGQEEVKQQQQQPPPPPPPPQQPHTGRVTDQVPPPQLPNPAGNATSGASSKHNSTNISGTGLKVFRKARLIPPLESNNLTSPEIQQVRNQPSQSSEHAKDEAMIVKPPTPLSLETQFFQRQQIVEELQRVEQELKEHGPLSPTSGLNNLLTPTTPPGPPPDSISQGGAGDLIQLFCEGMMCASTGVFHAGNHNQGLMVHSTVTSQSPIQLPTSVQQPITTPSEVVQGTAISDRPKVKPTWKKEGKNVRKQSVVAFQAALQQQPYLEHIPSTTGTVEGTSSAVTKSPQYYTNQILAQIQQQMDMNYPLHLHHPQIRTQQELLSEPCDMIKRQCPLLARADEALMDLSKPDPDATALIQSFIPDDVLQSVEDISSLSPEEVERMRFNASAANAFMAGVEAASKLIGPSPHPPFQVVPTDHGDFQVVHNHPDQSAPIQYLYTAVPSTTGTAAPQSTSAFQIPCQEFQAQLTADKNTSPSSSTRTRTDASSSVCTPAPAPANQVLPTSVATSVAGQQQQYQPQLILKAPPPWAKTENGTREQVQTGTQTSSEPGKKSHSSAAPSQTMAAAAAAAVTAVAASKKKPRYLHQKSTQAPPVHSDNNHTGYSGCETPATNPTVTPPFCMDVDSATDSNNDTALTLACAGGHEELVELLLSRGANIEHRDKKGFTPLILAATAGHEKVVETLMNHSADMEAQSERTKDTPLSLACSGGRYEVVELLLSKGANKEHRNVSDYTPLSLAASGGYVNIIKLLLTNGAEINSRTGSKLGISPLMLAAMNGHTAAVKLLLDMGSDINAQIETNRNTALTLACFQGRHEVVSLLLDRRANVEHRAKTGLTPLMEAASGGYVEVGRVLLDKGADVNAPPVPSSRDTALTIAADKGHCRFVELLLNRSAQVEVKNKKGNSPLWLAANGGHLAVVELLYNAGADIDSQDNRKVSCLMAAFRKGHVKVVKWMVNHVMQFPSDQEMTRYISTVNDKELLEKCQECTKIIRAAKDQQAAKANKNATILLEELYLEKTREESKKAAAAKKRERKKKKKLEKKEEKRKLQAENQKNERYTVEDEEEEEEDYQEEEEVKRTIKEIKDKTPGEVAAISDSPARIGPNGNVEGEEGDSGIDANSQGSCSSSEVKTGINRRKEKKKKKCNQQGQNVNSPIAPSTSKLEERRTTSVTISQTTCIKQQGKQNEKPETKGTRQQQTKSNKVLQAQQQQQPSLNFEPSRHPADREDFEATGNDVYSSAKTKKYAMPYCDEFSPPKTASSTSPKLAGGKREEGWKEVVRKYLNSPYRSKKVSVPLNAISRVIGRGGSNINAIRAVTGANIEVEKQSKGQGERIITLKGSAEATKEAHFLIATLINDPDVDILQMIPKSKSAVAVWEKSMSTAKSKLTNKSSQTSQAMSSSSAATKTTTTIGNLNGNSLTYISKVSTVNPSISSPRILAPRHATAVNKRQQTTSANALASGTKTTMSYTSAIMTYARSSGSSGKNGSNSGNSQTFAAKLSTIESQQPPTTSSTITGTSQLSVPVTVLVSSSSTTLNTTPPSTLIVPASPPQLRQPSPPITAVTPPTPSKQLVTSSPTVPSTATSISQISPNETSPTPPPTSTAPTTPSNPTTLEYSLFNDNFTKVTQQSMWGGRENEQKGMNFASVAANGMPNPMVMTTISNKYLDPSPPQVDASKAPGYPIYRGNSVCSPVAKGSTPTTSSGTSTQQNYYPAPSEPLQTVRPPPPPPVYASTAPQSTELEHTAYHPSPATISRLNPRAPDFATNFKPQIYPSGAQYLQQPIIPNSNVISFPINKYPGARPNGQRWPILAHGYPQTDVTHLSSLAMSQAGDLLGTLENGVSPNVSPSSPQTAQQQQQQQDDRKIPPRPIGTERAWKNYNISTQQEMEMNQPWLLEPKLSWQGTNMGPNQGLDRHHMYRNAPNPGPPPPFSRIPIQPEDLPHIIDTQYQAGLDGTGQFNAGAGISMMHSLPVINPHYNVPAVAAAAAAVGQELSSASDWEQARLPMQELPQDKTHIGSTTLGPFVHYSYMYK